MSSTTDRDAVLLGALAAVERQHGRGIVMRLDAPAEAVPVIPSGSVGIDLALGCGGYPRGRIVEIYGPESSAKTTLALHAIAEVHATGGHAAFIDAEHALDPAYAAGLGVCLPRLVLSQPDNGEQALDVVEALVRSGAFDLIVVDSVAALVPRDELEGSMADAAMGLQARMMSKAMRKLTIALAKSHTTLLFINQLRQKIGVTFGPTEETTGGNALKYFASIRIEVRRVGSIKREEEVVGSRIRVRVVKNKMAPPFRQAEVEVTHGKGLSRPAEVLDLAEARGFVERTGTWYTYGELQLGRSRGDAMAFLGANAEIRLAIERDLRVPEA